MPLTIATFDGPHSCRQRSSGATSKVPGLPETYGALKPLTCGNAVATGSKTPLGQRHWG